mgnify:CR=1 FL=1
MAEQTDTALSQSPPLDMGHDDAWYEHDGRSDIWVGLRNTHVWSALGWHDIRQRYRRSVLGPFWIVIATGDHVTSEAWLIPADNPTATPLLVSARKAGREYDVDTHGDTLFIHTNDAHTILFPNPHFITLDAQVERCLSAHCR